MSTVANDALVGYANGRIEEDSLIQVYAHLGMIYVQDNDEDHAHIYRFDIGEARQFARTLLQAADRAEDELPK